MGSDIPVSIGTGPRNHAIAAMPIRTGIGIRLGKLGSRGRSFSWGNPTFPHIEVPYEVSSQRDRHRPTGSLLGTRGLPGLGLVSGKKV